MIYLVHEFYDNREEDYFFDLSKVRPQNAFEREYLRVVQLAAQSKDAVDCTKNLAIRPRFSSYQDDSRGWNRLTIKPPCQVDAEAILIMSQ